MVKAKNFVIVIALILADQLSKYLVSLANQPIDLWIFQIIFVKNTGAIWGFFKGANTALVWISIIAIGVLLYLYDKVSEKGLFFYLLILAGIIGNLIDRLLRGFVVDFIDFGFWPVFNLADAFICIGVIGLIIFIWNQKPSLKSSRSSKFSR